MPKPQWTNKEQLNWLSIHIKDFAAAQEAKGSAMSRFFSQVYEDWFEEYPCPPPTPKQLETANGDPETAKALATKGMKDVSHRFHSKYPNADIP
jgi:hypothetical protein